MTFKKIQSNVYLTAKTACLSFYFHSNIVYILNLSSHFCQTSVNIIKVIRGIAGHKIICHQLKRMTSIEDSFIH